METRDQKHEHVRAKPAKGLLRRKAPEKTTVFSLRSWRSWREISDFRCPRIMTTLTIGTAGTVGTIATTIMSIPFKVMSRFSALVIFAFVLAACAATKLDQLQQDYSRLLVTIRAAEQSNGAVRGGGQLEAFQFELAEVARQAETEATQTTDPRTAIHFYTVGALAAWQAGPEGEKLLVTISEKGLARCKAMGDRQIPPPRDCAQLALVPTLGINDALVLELRRLTKKDIAEPMRLDTAKDLVVRTRENLRRLHNSREVLARLDGLSPGFTDYYERQKYKLYCNHREAITQLGDIPNGRAEAIAADKIASEQLLPMLAASLPRKDCFEFRGAER